MTTYSRSKRRDPRAFLSFKPDRAVPLRTYLAWARDMDRADQIQPA